MHIPWNASLLIPHQILKYETIRANGCQFEQLDLSLMIKQLTIITNNEKLLILIFLVFPIFDGKGNVDLLFAYCCFLIRLECIRPMMISALMRVY